MGANPIRKGTTSADVIRMSEAEFIASTRIWKADECMSPTDGANVGKHKWGNDVDVFVDLDYMEDAGGIGGYSPPIPQSDVTDLGTDLTTLQTNITNEATTRAAADLILAAPTVELDTGSTNTALDPGVGIIRFNHGTIASVTEVAVSDVINGVDKGDLLLAAGGILQLRLVGTTTTIEFRIVSAVHTTWTRFTVVYLKGALPADATVLAMRFLPLIGINAATQTALDLKDRTGKLVWVDSVNGNDGTGARQRADLPFLTLGAASTAASSGDTVFVLPGTYTPATTIAKTGVNWYFESGAIVSMSAATGAIFSDAGGAIVCSITGHGVFNRSGAAGAGTNVLRMTNASSVIHLECATITNAVATEGTAGDAAAIYHENGGFTLNCRSVTSVFDAYYWIAGPATLTVAEYITSSAHNGIYCVVPDGNADEVYVRCPNITAFAQAIYTFRVTPGDDGSGFRLWVVAETIGNGRTAVQVGPGKVYVTAQKLFVLNNTVGEVITFSPEAGDQLYINTQKIGVADSVTSLGADFSLIRTDGADGVCRIQCMEIDLKGITSSAATALIKAEGTNMDFELSGATFNAQAAIDCPIISQSASTGSRVFVNCRFSNQAPEPIVLTDSITTIQNCVIRTADTESVIAASALTFTSLSSSVDKALNANVSMRGNLYLEDATPTSAGRVATTNADGTWSWV